MSSTFQFDGYFGGLNLFKRWEQRSILDPGERPPYPVILSNPTIGDVVSNFNKAEVGIMIFFTALGLPLSRGVLKSLPVYTEYSRRGLFTLCWNFVIAWGGLFALQNSHHRLQGFADNGLQWKRKETKLLKYDFSKDFEDKTIWKHFRLREQ